MASLFEGRFITSQVPSVPQLKQTMRNKPRLQPRLVQDGELSISSPTSGRSDPSPVLGDQFRPDATASTWCGGFGEWSKFAAAVNEFPREFELGEMPVHLVGDRGFAMQLACGLQGSS